MPPVSQRYVKLQKEWKIKEQFWSAIHYTLGISSAILAAVVAFKVQPEFLSTEVYRLLALGSAVLATILTFLSPASKRKAYSEARDLLRVTRSRYETEDIPVSVVNDAIEKAQSIVTRR